jgi:hypothetical protein
VVSAENLSSRLRGLGLGAESAAKRFSRCRRFVRSLAVGSPATSTGLQVGIPRSKGVKMSVPATNGWKLRDDYAALDSILLDDLRDLLRDEFDGETRKWLLVVLDELVGTLPREFHLREEGGYLADVVSRFPNWSDRVERLHREYEGLIDRLHRLRDDVLQADWAADTAAHVRRELAEWVNTMVAQDRHERRLLQLATNLDIGGSME